MTERDGFVSTDLRAFAEALADVLTERGFLGQTAGGSPERILNATEVARLLGRERQWVYDHAAELGAFRYGEGPKARLGFDMAEVQRWKRDRRIQQETPARARRRRPARPKARDGGANLLPYKPYRP